MSKKVILITGASSGLGKVLAEYFTIKGHTVYGTSRSTITGNTFKTLTMDVCSEESIQKAVTTILNEQDKIDVVINNAGIGITAVSEHLSIADAEKVINTNLLGVMRVCRLVIPSMREKRNGLIINISSIAAEIGLPYRGVYSASKAGVDRFTQALRIELKAYGIQACCIQAGGIKTDIDKNRLVSPMPPNSPYKESFDRNRQIVNHSVSFGLEPELFGPIVEKIIYTQKTKSIYRIGKLTEKLSVLVKRLVPDLMFENIIKNNFKI